MAAERKRWKCHRQLAVEVVLFAVEERMLLHVDDDVEVAGRAAGAAMFALSIESAGVDRWRCRQGS